MNAKQYRETILRNLSTARNVVAHLNHQMKHRAMKPEEMVYLSDMQEYIRLATEIVGGKA